MILKELVLTIIIIISLIHHHYLFYIACKQPNKTTFNDISKKLVISRIFCNLLLILYLWIIILKKNINNIFPKTKIGLYIGIPLIVIGQILQASVYNALGFKGVYYGVETGEIKNPTKIDGFPFNIMPHPQYIGIIICFIGFFIYFGIDKNYNINTNTLILTIFIITLYLLSIYMEINCKIKDEKTI